MIKTFGERGRNSEIYVPSTPSSVLVFDVPQTEYVT